MTTASAHPGSRPDRLRSPSSVLLLLKMTGWALVLPVLKRVVGIARLTRLMWRSGARAGVAKEATEGDVRRIVTLSRAATRIWPGRRENCVDRSLIAYRYLSAANADPRLVVAARRGPEGIAGHVWIELADGPIGEDDLSIFTPITAFGAKGLVVSLTER